MYDKGVITRSLGDTASYSSDVTIFDELRSNESNMVTSRDVMCAFSCFVKYRSADRDDSRSERISTHYSNDFPTKTW